VAAWINLGACLPGAAARMDAAGLQPAEVAAATFCASGVLA